MCLRVCEKLRVAEIEKKEMSLEEKKGFTGAGQEGLQWHCEEVGLFIGVYRKQVIICKYRSV